MFYQKMAFAIVSLSSFLLFAQSSSAEPSFAKKYAPYIGYQHGYTNFSFGLNKSTLKYTPRIFMGMNPIKTENYRFGVEIGYTIPALAKHQDVELKSSNTDLFLTALRPIGKNSHWFIQPGMEYQQKQYSSDENKGSDSSVYLGIKTGIGYVFNNGLSLNTTAATRLVDLNDNSKPKKFIFGLNAQYAF